MNEIILLNVLSVGNQERGAILKKDLEQNKEEILLSQAQQGDELAFSQLIQLHYSFLYKYLIKMTCDSDLTEDLLQETLLKGFLHLNKYDGSSKFSSWLITIATRNYLDYLRKKKRERWLFKKVEKQYDESLRWQMRQNNTFSEVIEIIAALDAHYRIPVLLKHYYGFSYMEIGEMMDIKEGTAKSRVHKSLQLIRKEMKKIDEENREIHI